MNDDELWDVYIEEDEYVVRLVIDGPCEDEDCPCHGEGYVKQYQVIERKKYKEPPEPGSLEDRQMKWILGKVAGEEGLGPLPKE